MFSSTMLRFGPGGRVLTAVAAPPYEGGTTPVNSVGRLAVQQAAPVSWANGMGFAADGSVAVGPGPVAFYHQGYGFNAAGRLVVNSVGPISGYLAGIPRTPNGGIAIAP